MCCLESEFCTTLVHMLDFRMQCMANRQNELRANTLQSCSCFQQTLPILADMLYNMLRPAAAQSLVQSAKCTIKTYTA